MVAFCLLADEVVLEVCNQISPEPSIYDHDPEFMSPTLVALSSTSHRMRRICWPMLFRALVVTKDNYAKLMEYHLHMLVYTRQVLSPRAPRTAHIGRRIILVRFTNSPGESFYAYRENLPTIFVHVPALTTLHLRLDHSPKGVPAEPLSRCLHRIASSSDSVLHVSLFGDGTLSPLNADILDPFLLACRVDSIEMTLLMAIRMDRNHAYFGSLQTLRIASHSRQSFKRTILLTRPYALRLRQLVMHPLDPMSTRGEGGPQEIDGIMREEESLAILKTLTSLESLSCDFRVVLPTNNPSEHESGSRLARLARLNAVQKPWAKLIADHCPTLKTVSLGEGCLEAVKDGHERALWTFKLPPWRVVRDTRGRVIDVELTTPEGFIDEESR